MFKAYDEDDTAQVQTPADESLPTETFNAYDRAFAARIG